MAWHTCFSSISYFGHKLDALKSGVQKYLRRREYRKMLWCVAEIYLFKVFAKSPLEKQATKGIISNLLNRLIIMLDEEMLFCEWAKYLAVRKLMEEFEAGGREDFLALVKICKIMCNARLLRRNSDIRAFFGYALKGKPPPELVKREGKNYDKYYYANFVAYFKKVDEGNLHDACYCFYWYLKLYRRKGVGKVFRFRRKENIYMIWEFLMKRAFGNPKLRKCLRYRLEQFHNKAKKERLLFMTAAIDLSLHAAKFDWSETFTPPATDLADLREVFEGRQNLILDDYVIDMHCSEGRKKGKNKRDFAISGSLVVGEDQEYLVRAWRRRYNRR